MQPIPLRRDQRPAACDCTAADAEETERDFDEEQEEDPDDWELLEPDDADLMADPLDDPLFDDDDEPDDDWSTIPNRDEQEWGLASRGELAASTTMVRTDWRKGAIR